MALFELSRPQIGKLRVAPITEVVLGVLEAVGIDKTCVERVIRLRRTAKFAKIMIFFENPEILFRTGILLVNTDSGI